MTNLSDFCTSCQTFWTGYAHFMFLTLALEDVTGCHQRAKFLVSSAIGLIGVNCLALLSFTVVLTVAHRYLSVTVEVKGWTSLVCRELARELCLDHTAGHGVWQWKCVIFFVLVLEKQTWMPAVEGSSSWPTARVLESFTPMGKTTTHLSP